MARFNRERATNKLDMTSFLDEWVAVFLVGNHVQSTKEHQFKTKFGKTEEA